MRRCARPPYGTRRARTTRNDRASPKWRPVSMARNGGQVYGVFCEFLPEKGIRHLLRSHYTKADSVDFERFI